MNLKNIIISIVVVLIAGGAFIFSGVFNISAKDKHWGITSAVMELTRERSIEVRAADIEIPNNLDDLEMVSNGAKNYDAMCSQCHLAPAMEATELNLGLYPQPPVFYKEEHEDHGLNNTYWIIKNGLKLTGMPAWGDFHTEKQMWEMVAFLDKLSGMTKTQYDELVGEGGHTHKAGGHGGGGHGDSQASGGHHGEATTTESTAGHHQQADVAKGHDNTDGHHNVVVPKGHDNSDGHHDPVKKTSGHAETGHAH